MGTSKREITAQKQDGRHVYVVTDSIAFDNYNDVGEVLGRLRNEKARLENQRVHVNRSLAKIDEEIAALETLYANMEAESPQGKG